MAIHAMRQKAHQQHRNGGKHADDSKKEDKDTRHHARETHSRSRGSRQSSSAVPFQMAVSMMPQPLRELFTAPFSAFTDSSAQSPFFTMRRDLMRWADQVMCTFLQSQDAAQSLLRGATSAPSHFAANDNEYRFIMDLPGMDADNTEVSVVPGALMISARTAQEKRNGREGKASFFFSRMEEVERIFPLPWDANTEEAEAQFSNGRLEVNIPRIAGLSQPEPRSIQITGRSSGTRRGEEAQERKAS